MFTALPDSASSLFTATQTANDCTGHDARRRCSEYTMAVIFILYLLGSVSPPRVSFLGSFVACKQAKLEAKLASWSVHFTRPTACTRDEYGFNFVITSLHGKYPIYKHHVLGATPSGSVLVNRIYPSQGCNNTILKLISDVVVLGIGYRESASHIITASGLMLLHDNC